MIRRYNKDDIESIILLEKETLNTTLGDKLFLDLNNSLSRNYVYYENNKLIAYISTSYDGDVIEIENFCVKENYQNKHIGTYLLSYVLEDIYKENKYVTSAILEVRESNSKAIHVYDKLGFKKINVRHNYYSNGEDAIVMNKLFVDIDTIKNYYDSLNPKKNSFSLNEHNTYLHNNIHLINLNYFYNNVTFKLLDETNKDDINELFRIISPAYNLMTFNPIINDLTNKKIKTYGIFDNNKLVMIASILKFENSLFIKDIKMIDYKKKYESDYLKYIISECKDIFDIFIEINNSFELIDIFKNLNFNELN